VFAELTAQHSARQRVGPTKKLVVVSFEIDDGEHRRLGGASAVIRTGGTPMLPKRYQYQKIGEGIRFWTKMRRRAESPANC
jgi:hypothetical protein